MAPNSETIAALSTPVGTSAIAVVRASGPASAKIFTELFGSPHPRQLRHSDYRNLEGKLLDDVLAVYFPGPKSYSGEDSLEVSCHGNPLIAQKILEDLFRRGARAAEPGEFTRRAFLNGRLDLSQAEAVVDLIGARSDRALEAANQQLRGGLAQHLAQLTDSLLNILARIEAYIDFPDEDLPAEDRRRVVEELIVVLRGTERLLATEHYGGLLRDGIKTVILGEPNAGKSSLLNRLLGRDRALVSPEPGTTRDFIEERLMVGSHCIRLIDTAGLNANPAPLEKEGMQKTLERAAEADLFLIVQDGTRGSPKLSPAIVERLRVENTIIVLNKSDLPNTVARDEHPTPPDFNVTRISALTGAGISALVEQVAALADGFSGQNGTESVAINARHADALRRAETTLRAAHLRLEASGATELIASDLRNALDAFGEIGGRVDNERMLDKLFARFCIGK